MPCSPFSFVEVAFVVVGHPAKVLLRTSLWLTIPRSAISKHPGNILAASCGYHRAHLRHFLQILYFFWATPATPSTENFSSFPSYLLHLPEGIARTLNLMPPALEFSQTHCQDYSFAFFLLKLRFPYIKFFFLSKIKHLFKPLWLNLCMQVALQI